MTWRTYVVVFFAALTLFLGALGVIAHNHPTRLGAPSVVGLSILLAVAIVAVLYWLDPRHLPRTVALSALSALIMGHVASIGSVVLVVREQLFAGFSVDPPHWSFNVVCGVIVVVALFLWKAQQNVAAFPAPSSSSPASVIPSATASAPSGPSPSHAVNLTQAGSNNFQLHGSNNVVSFQAPPPAPQASSRDRLSAVLSTYVKVASEYRSAVSEAQSGASSAREVELTPLIAERETEVKAMFGSRLHAHVDEVRQGFFRMDHGQSFGEALRRLKEAALAEIEARCTSL